jgi:preprotein translocase subunit SecG
MTVIRTLLIILEAACSLALIGLILLQKSKSEGLGTAFGGGGNDSLFGARAGNVLTKATVGIGILFLVNTLILGMLFAGSAGKSLLDDAQDAPVETPVMPTAAPDAPGVPAVPVAPVE